MATFDERTRDRVEKHSQHVFHSLFPMELVIHYARPYNCIIAIIILSNILSELKTKLYFIREKKFKKKKNHFTI